jgi:hypothetical protein
MKLSGSWIHATHCVSASVEMCAAEHVHGRHTADGPDERDPEHDPAHRVPRHPGGEDRADDGETDRQDHIDRVGLIERSDRNAVRDQERHGGEPRRQPEARDGPCKPTQP